MVREYLDNDEAGRKGITDAETKGILKPNEYILSSCRGMQNSEFEDLIDLNSYRQLIIDDYAVDLNIPSFKVNTKQWSDRVKELFRLHGKIWSDRLESEIKYKVSKQAASLKLESLNPNKTHTIDALVTTIENVLDRQK